MTKRAMKVVCCYAHKDKALRSELQKHLSVLLHLEAIDIWHDGEILPGDDWKQEIAFQISHADIILLLISSDFLASYHCYHVEMNLALERHRRGDARVVPIFLRSVLFADLPFASLEMLPSKAKPVAEWTNKDKAFTNVAQGILDVVRNLQDSKPVQRAQRKGKSISIRGQSTDFTGNAPVRPTDFSSVAPRRPADFSPAQLPTPYTATPAQLPTPYTATPAQGRTPFTGPPMTQARTPFGGPGIVPPNNLGGPGIVPPNNLGSTDIVLASIEKTESAKEESINGTRPVQEGPINGTRPVQEGPINGTRPVQEGPINLPRPVQEGPIEAIPPDEYGILHSFESEDVVPLLREILNLEPKNLSSDVSPPPNGFLGQNALSASTILLQFKSVLASWLSKRKRKK